MQLAELPESVMLAVTAGVGWLGRHLFGWWRDRSKDAAAAEVTLSGGWKTLVEQLRTEMAAREALCDQRIAAAVAEVRAEFEEQNLKLRSIVYSLAKGKPLDRKQKSLLEQIAPRAELTVD